MWPTRASRGPDPRSTSSRLAKSYRTSARGSSPNSLSSLASCTTQTPDQLSELTLQPRKLYNTNTRPALPTHSPASQAVQHKHQTSSPNSLSSLASCTTQTPDQLSQLTLQPRKLYNTNTRPALPELTRQPRKLYNTNTRPALPELTRQPRKLYNTNTRPALPELTLQPRKLSNTNTRCVEASETASASWIEMILPNDSVNTIYYVLDCLPCAYFALNN